MPEPAVFARRDLSCRCALDVPAAAVYTSAFMTCPPLLAFTNRTPGILALEDGRCFTGVSVGYEGQSTGEVVFNTSMTGYQEIITDNSYAGQIVVMTYPQIGNTGFNPEDHESAKPRIQGFLMREYSPGMSNRISNWRATESLGDYLKRHQIPALSEIDTRSLTRHLRTHGLKRGIIAVGSWKTDDLIQKALASPKLEELDLVGQLTVDKPVEWTESCPWIQKPVCAANVAVFDFGIKQNIMRSLVSLGAKVTVVPAGTTAETVLKMQPQGVILSNGPGDPARLENIVAEIRKLIGCVPVFGICLGHQLLGRAFGASTYKMKFGHRGANQPVLNKQTGRVEITSQNHSFCVDPATLPPDVEVSHVNLNDGTVEGIRHKTLPVFSVQYHPEAAAGPHDAEYLFEQFLQFGRKISSPAR
ncbi:MAG: glutamine-hydrolyzing carbamoyl-phosphate synthase small subunit [Planctomycetaceae bacterium]|jgi:carbamoyl-phosphate synthase small subunit|nr:glutamine-hydrolyzing carbamoyl-phosphate synthase small subunit [Planctomycetaceae bacterium]